MAMSALRDPHPTGLGRERRARRRREGPGHRSALLLIPVLLLLAWGVIPPGADSSQSTGPNPGELPAEFPKPTVRAYLSHEALPAGATGTLLVVFDVPEDSHIQINEFLEVLLPDDSPLSVAPWTITRTETYGKDNVLKGTTSLKCSFTIKPGTPPGLIDATLSVGYQGCVEAPRYACYPPEQLEIPLRLEVLPPGATSRGANIEIFQMHGGPLGSTETGSVTPAAPASQGNLASRLEGALAKRSLLAFLLVFLGGVVTSFTPCVYPMIPITISYIGGRARHRAQGFVLSLFFVLGIAIMYSALGLIAASTGSIFGAAMQSATVMILVAIIFAAMGTSMLGAFDLTLPAGLQSRMTSGAQRGGILGSVLMGMVTGLVASPCVGPVLVVLLTFVAKTGSLFLGFWLLFTFACGLGLLFLILGTFAGAISALPGAGEWMDTIKHVFGVVLIGMAIFYLRAVLGPSITRLAFGVYLVFVGVFTGSFTPLPQSPSKGRLFGKAMGILLFLSGALIFLVWLAGIAGLPAMLPGSAGAPAATGATPAALTGTAPGRAHAGPAWRINDETALAEAKASGRPAMQDFYADWCAACVELDEKTWVDPAIVAESQRFVAVKMDFTKRDEFSKAATARYTVRGMPTVIFYDSQGNEATRFFGFRGAEEVLALMRSVE